MNKLWLTTLIFVCAGIQLSSGNTEKINEFVDNNCIDCHDDDTKKGGVSFEIDLSKNPKLVSTMFKAVRGGNMPPAKKKQPIVAMTNAINAFIKRERSSFKCSKSGARDASISSGITSGISSSTLRTRG